MRWLEDLVGKNPSEGLSDYVDGYRCRKEEDPRSLAHALYLANDEVDSLE